MFKIRLSTESIRIIKNMAKLPAQIKDAVRLSLQQGALAIQNESKILAPYKTGNLRRSITHGTVAGSNGFAVAVGSSVVYARIHEYGGDTGRGHATHLEPYNKQGYFRPAIEKTRSLIQTYFDKNIGSAIKSL